MGGCVGPRGGRVYGPNKHCGQLSLRCLNTNPIISNKKNAKPKLNLIQHLFSLLITLLSCHGGFVTGGTRCQIVHIGRSECRGTI